MILYAAKNGKILGQDAVDHTFNPMVHILTLNQNEEHIEPITLTDLLNKIRVNERKRVTSTSKRFLTKWELMFTMSNIPDAIVKLVHDAGSYSIKAFKFAPGGPTNEDIKRIFSAELIMGIDVYHPRISREMFKLQEQSPEILEYIRLLYGERASRGFWGSESEYENILRYEALYMLDLDTREKATHIVTNDLRHMRIPTTIKAEMQFTILQLAQIAYPDIAPWDMKSIPRGYAMDGDVLYSAITDTMHVNEVGSVDELTRKMLMLNAPSVLNKLKSMKAVVEFYNMY